MVSRLVRAQLLTCKSLCAERARMIVKRTTWLSKCARMSVNHATEAIEDVRSLSSVHQ